MWSAHDRDTGQDLAIKLLHRRIVGDTQAVDRIRRESSVLKAFLHLSIVRVREVVEADGALALVMELVRGEDLGCKLARIGPLPKADAVEYARSLAEAIAAAHAAGVVHCESNPRTSSSPTTVRCGCRTSGWRG